MSASNPAPRAFGDPNARLLEVEDLTVTFPTSRGDVDVVKDISFGLEAGQTLGIVGESGSGKSMTSLAIMGLLPRGGRTRGSIRLKGEELTSRSDKQLRRIRGDRVGMIFQDPLSSLNPYYTVGLQIEEAYRAHRGGSRKAARAVAIDALKRVQIKDAENRIDYYPHQFSGGMRQRIMIAMATVLEPDLLIADEPTTALDVTVQAQILRLLSELQQAIGMGMILITHDLAVVSEVANHVLVMRDGIQVEQGAVEDVFSRTTQPYTRALLDAVPRIGDVVGTLKEIGE